MSSKTNWIATNASVFSADYIEPNAEARPFWNVTYSYRVGEEYYSGQFADFASDEAMSYHKDDVVQIEYRASNPERSRFPGATTWWSKSKTPFAIGGVLGLAFIILYVLTH
jgi:hypothetical protein